MSKKRYLSIFVIIVLLFIVGAVVTIDQVQMIEVCRNALSSDRPGYTYYTCGDTIIYSPLRYERTTSSSPPSVTVYFDDGTNDMWCHMERKGSEWVVAGWGSTIVGMCP